MSANNNKWKKHGYNNNYNYNNFNQFNTIENRNSSNRQQNRNSKNKEKTNYKVQKKIKVEIKPINENMMKQRKTKSEEKKIYTYQYEYFSDMLEKEIKLDIEQKEKYKSFIFDKKTIKKCSNKNEIFPFFSDIANKKGSFLEKNIKNLIKDSSILHSYNCIFSKNKNLKNIDIASLVETPDAFKLNIDRLKSGVDNYIHNFKKIMLFKYNFSFDKNYIKKLEPFVDDEKDINLNYFSKENQIFTAYKNKNIKGLNLCNAEDILKPLNEIKIENENDIYGSIDKINQRWMNKKKCTKIFHKPDIDNYKLLLCSKNYSEIPLISQAFNEFAKQKIRSMETDNIIIKKPNIDSTFDEFTTEIYSFK